MTSASNKPMTYAGAGVDIDAGDRMVEMIRQHTHRTYGPRVLGQFGSFAGMFRLDFNEKLFKRNYKEPVLVGCTDGVGTKVKLAAELKIYDTVGIDLVAMSVNDLIVQGAEPLFFLDYLAVNKLDPEQCTAMVKGVSDGCVDADCALLGGETAEMPDVYSPGEFDMAGFAVGVVELRRVVEGEGAEAGDVILGIASSGIHSNGYSLVRAIVREKKLDLHRVYPELDPDRTLGRVLLTPTRIYARPIVSVLRHYSVKKPITSMSHITGSGLPGNIPRTLGSHLDAKISKKAWEIPAVFKFLQEKGNVADEEMFNVFNMGIGYTLTIRPHFADSVREQLRKHGQDVCVLGKLTRGTGRVVMG
ncbi:MAG: phosphoribosylformylglycinamidine cyclo-ligase [Phycisphaera sp.]|nr:phosphoribosylformylglycinamidine cyclo-ligase [Phycisphaera sp.]